MAALSAHTRPLRRPQGAAARLRPLLDGARGGVAASSTCTQQEAEIAYVRPEIAGGAIDSRADALNPPPHHLDPRILPLRDMRPLRHDRRALDERGFALLRQATDVALERVGVAESEERRVYFEQMERLACEATGACPSCPLCQRHSAG